MIRKRNINKRVYNRIKSLKVPVYTRWQWGNRSNVYQLRRINKPHKQIPKTPTDTIVGHITVTNDGDIKESMQLLHKIGMERFGSGVSYNFAISMKTGEVGIGMPLDAKGTHTNNDKHVPNFSSNELNYYSVAIAFIGVPGDVPTKKAIRAAEVIIASMMLEKACTVNPDWVPHSLFAAKECPTDAVRSVMPLIFQGAKTIYDRHK